MTLNHSPEADAMTCQQISSSITSILDGGGKPLVQKNSEKGGSGVSMPKMSDEQKAKLKGMMNMFGGEK